MRIIARSTLQRFWEKHSESEQPLKSWFKVTKNAKWKDPNDVKECYKSASILLQGRVVFNIAGNKYRLIAHINYTKSILFIKFIGTHSEYDKIDAQTVMLTQRKKKNASKTNKK
jgi:mRNA interferase HigB